jgi:D-alanyl-lipoteichoic acid acyltransferase DltB (MBOAT superfamily)
MLFNSFNYLVFLVSVWVVFWFVLKDKTKWQQLFLLLVSCYFYMFFIPKYILILGLTIAVDYWAGIALERQESERKRKVILWVSVVVTCAILFVFKYYNFFSENIRALSEYFGGEWSIGILSWALPIGLSFHTFQSLSYVFEVYYKRQAAERNFLTYSLYVMYFPQLVAGPIERPGNLLQQLNKPFSFDATLASDGLRMILWGLFKKVVIADSCAIIVNTTYLNMEGASTLDLWYAAVLFSIQIYGDFSGYSDIARGSSQLMGIRLISNFQFPYFSKSITEFWSRWHTSLSSWFRDYVYIPLGGNRVSALKQSRNILIVFVLSGFWHGAQWTFIVWGLVNAGFILLEKSVSWSKRAQSVVLIPLTFLITTCIWVFFRAESMTQAWAQLYRMLFDFHGGSQIVVDKKLWLMIVFFFVLEWIQRSRVHGLDVQHWRPSYRYSAYVLVYLLVFFMAVYPANQFIYFQF